MDGHTRKVRQGLRVAGDGTMSCTGGNAGDAHFCFCFTGASALRRLQLFVAGRSGGESRNPLGSVRVWPWLVQPAGGCCCKCLSLERHLLVGRLAAWIAAGQRALGPRESIHLQGAVRLWDRSVSSLARLPTNRSLSGARDYEGARSGSWVGGGRGLEHRYEKLFRRPAIGCP